MKKKIIIIISIVVVIALVIAIEIVARSKRDGKEINQEATQSQEVQIPITNLKEDPAKIISEENATQSIKDYNIDSNTIKYKETDLSLDINYKDEKIIYNKNNVIITFKSLKDDDMNEVGKFVVLSIENKSKDELSFESDSMLVNDTIAIPCDISETVPASGKVDVTTIIYPETLYENHINNINNLSFVVKLDFNDYEKIRESKENWDIIKLSDYSDKIFRDITKIINFETNSIKPFDEPKGETLFSNDIMDITFEGFLDNQVDYSRSNNYQKGFFKITNKSNEYIRINVHDFVLNQDPSIDYIINSDGCFIPPNKTGYCFFAPVIDESSENRVINKLKKCDSLSFTFDINQDLTDEEISSLDFIISFKK